MGRTSDYGDQYLCIRLKNNEDIYVYADQADIVDGAIVLSNKMGRRNLMIAPGQWESCYVASRSDSSPLAIQSWAPRPEGVQHWIREAV
ncbi:MAG: hypothetical protein ABW047_02920 [Nitrospiraceae bacterium]